MILFPLLGLCLCLHRNISVDSCASAHGLRPALIKQHTPQSQHKSPQQDEKAPNQIPVGRSHIEHHRKQVAPYLQVNGDGKQVKQQVAAAEKVDPAPLPMLRLAFAIQAAVHALLAVGYLKDVGQFLLDGGDAAGVLAVV